MRRSRLARTVVVTVVILAAGLLIWAVTGALSFALQPNRGGFWAMAIAAVLVDIPLFGLARRTGTRTHATLSPCFTFAIFVLWGAAPAILVQAAAGAVTVAGQRYRPWAGMFLIGRLVCALAAAQVVANLVDPEPLTRVGQGLNGGDLLVFLLVAAVWFTVSYGLLLLVSGAAGSRRLRQAAAELRGDLRSTATAVVLVSPLLTTISCAWKALVGIPLIVLNQLVREQVHLEAELSREPVTGILNRQGLTVGVQELTGQQGGQDPQPFGMVLVNVEAALEVNRTLGRNMYERVVGSAADRLGDAYGRDRLGRPTGEGFVVLVPGLLEAEALVEAERARRVLAEPIRMDGIPFTLDPVAGVALSPMHGTDLNTLLAKSEIAAAQARQSGRHTMLYVRQAEAEVNRRLELLHELHATLDDPGRRGEVGIVVQPQVDLATGRLAGVEALVRWTHPRWGPISADELIEAIEPTAIMHQLTMRVLSLAGEQIQRWTNEGWPLRVAVNVSVQDMQEDQFIAELEELTRRYRIEPRQLTIEITERMLLADAPRVTEASAAVAELGMGLSLDDFGAGYASLQQLRQLPLTEVKIDRSYIANLAQSAADHSIVQSVHQLATTLGVDVVAEGIEDRPTAEALSEFAGMIGQGWYFGKPMDAAALRTWHEERGRSADAGAGLTPSPATGLDRGDSGGGPLSPAEGP